MKISAEQLSQAQAAHAELRAAMYHVENTGLDGNGNAVRADEGAYHHAAQTVLWPLLDRLWQLFDELAPIVAEEAEVRLGEAVKLLNDFDEFTEGESQESQDARAILGMLKTNAETVEKCMRNGWQWSIGAGHAMEHTFRWACGLGGFPPPMLPGPPPLSHPPFPPA